MANFDTKELKFKAKIFKNPTVSYAREPGTGKAGYAGHCSQGKDIALTFHYEGKDHAENIRDTLMAFIGRQKVNQTVEDAVIAAEAETGKKITIDVDSNRKFVRINQAWFEDFLRKVKESIENG